MVVHSNVDATLTNPSLPYMVATHPVYIIIVVSVVACGANYVYVSLVPRLCICKQDDVSRASV